MPSRKPQVNVRLDDQTMMAWKQAAAARGVSVTQWVRDIVNAALTEGERAATPAENGVTFGDGGFSTPTTPPPSVNAEGVLAETGRTHAEPESASSGSGVSEGGPTTEAIVAPPVSASTQEVAAPSDTTAPRENGDPEHVAGETDGAAALLDRMERMKERLERQ